MPLDNVELKEALIAEIKTAMEKRDEVASNLHEQIEHLKTKSSDDQTDINGRIDETKTAIDELSDTIDGLQKKMDRSAFSEQPKTLGRQLVESEEFKAACVETDFNGTMSFEGKDITNAANMDGGRSILVPEHFTGMVAPVEQKLLVRSLIPQGTTSSNAIRHIQEKVVVDAAAMVAEGGLIGKSDITFEQAITPVQKIAHRFDLSAEVINDTSMLQGYIDNRGIYMVKLLEEEQLLNGDLATNSSDLTGLATNATAFDPSTISGYAPANMVDEIRVASLQVRMAQIPASGVVVNPSDWAAIELLKDTQGNYLHASVTSGAVPRLWGLPVVVSDSMAVGKFLVGAFSLGAHIWDRSKIRAELSTENVDNFDKDMVTIRIIKRLALEITRPQAFIAN